MTSVWGLARATSVALVGMEATPVEVEAWIGSGLPRTCMVGLPDAALVQAKERVRAAVLSAGYSWPPQVLTINLLPATLPKTGSHYDLGIAAAVLSAQGLVDPGSLRGLLLFGELGLDGRIHGVRGVFPALLGGSRLGMTQAVVPANQLAEASLVEGIKVRGVATLRDLVDVLRGGPGVEGVPPDKTSPKTESVGDLADVVGMSAAKWALEVAAAGRHHLYFHGPPGVGKTMLATCLPAILPNLSSPEALEVAAIHSLMGADVDHLPSRPPFAAPHHSASLASLVGGGTKVARPGAVSLAHRGVLFLDEAPEFSAQALESLRTPLESGEITLGRSEATVKYPARFQLVLAANPCPCGLAATPRSVCHCTPMSIRRYTTRISGPILDRIDIRAPIQPIRASLLAKAGKEERSCVVADRVAEARERQARRLKDTPWMTNSELPGPYVRSLPTPSGADVLEKAVSAGQLSHRGVDKVIRVAWTIADLMGADRVGLDHVRVALSMRQGEEIR